MRYRKKPVTIEAWLNTDDGEPVPAWVDNNSQRIAGGRFLVRTLEGVMVAEAGDYIIKGIAGEVYPCKPHIFEASYEEVE